MRTLQTLPAMSYKSLNVNQDLHIVWSDFGAHWCGLLGLLFNNTSLGFGMCRNVVILKIQEGLELNSRSFIKPMQM